MTLIVYCKDHKRRPIRFGYAPALRDVQGDIPPAWCSICGCEVFDAGCDRCSMCRRSKGEKRL